MYRIFLVMLLLNASRVISFDFEVEGSGEVCDVEGSTCPENTCCRTELCKKDGNGLQCCKNPDENPVECAKCPMCGESY